jgi:hypothetical protein
MALVCVLLAGFPTLAQSPGSGLSGSAGAAQTSSQQSAQGKPERMTAQNLVFQRFEPSQIVLSNDLYVYTLSTSYTSLTGRNISRKDLKAGQVVDIVYLTGGRKTEGYPYRPFEKVLVSVRVVAEAKKR